MAKAIVICKEVQSGQSKGSPDVGTAYSGFVYIGDLPGQYAAYVITGTPAQLIAIDGHANTLVGTLVTENNGVKWDELKVPVPAAARTKINNWRQANGQANIPANITWLQVFKVAANKFDLDGSYDVFDPE